MLEGRRLLIATADGKGKYGSGEMGRKGHLEASTRAVWCRHAHFDSPPPTAGDHKVVRGHQLFGCISPFGPLDDGNHCWAKCSKLIV